MHTASVAHRMIRERGPRYAVSGTIRAREIRVEYAETSEQAEKIREDFEDSWGYRQVKVYPPAGSVDLVQLGRQRQDAKRALDDVTQILRAGVLHAINDEHRDEAEVARAANLDRMTVRDWLGKRKRTAGAALAVDIMDRIRAAYTELAAAPGAWVSLTRLRRALADVARSDLDAALLRLVLEPKVRLNPEFNRKTLTAADRAAALRTGGEDVHLLSIGQP